MKKIVMLVFVGMLLLSACGAPGDVEVQDPWVRSTMQGQNTAIYFQLNNNSGEAVDLTGASANISDQVEIHQSKMVDSVMQMNMVSSIPVAAGDGVTFAPGGYHVMVVGVNRELKVGDHVSVTLHFKNHDDITVDAVIKDQSGMDMGN